MNEEELKKEEDIERKRESYISQMKKSIVSTTNQNPSSSRVEPLPDAKKYLYCVFSGNYPQYIRNAL